MALSSAKRVTTIVLDAETDRLLGIAARELGTSRSGFVRAQLHRVLQQFRQHPRPRSAGVVKSRITNRSSEAELFREIER
jgi:hypothetical protein